MTSTTHWETLAHQADQIAGLFESKFFDPSGLPYAYLNKQTRKPFTAEEMEGYPLDFPGRPPLAQWISHENTPMVAGHYLSALCEENALGDNESRISRIFSSIRHLVSISETSSPPAGSANPTGAAPPGNPVAINTEPSSLACGNWRSSKPTPVPPKRER